MATSGRCDPTGPNRFGGLSRRQSKFSNAAFVTYRKDGSREFIFNLANSATSLIDADSLEAGLTEGCRFFHVMGTSLSSEGMIAAVKQGIRRVKEGGGKVSFDPNIRPEVMSSDFIRDAIDFVLKECDILLPSEADLHYFCGKLPEAAAVRQLFSKWTLERVVVKNAAKGSTYYDHSQSIHVPSFKVTEVEGYVRAGFTKVHLDASMACADDPQPLSDETVAARAADLCQAAVN